MIKVHEISIDRGWQEYLQVPRLIYRNDHFWTPFPPESERAMFDPRSNPLLRYLQIELFVAMEDNQPVGRVAAITDELLEDKRVGLFGCFESIDSQEVTSALLGAAANSLRKRGKTEMQGPATINTTQQVGILIDGFDTPPQPMMPYNPTYYQKLLEQAGCEKILDLYSYQWIPHETPELKKIGKIANRASRIPGIRLRSINLRDPWGEGKKLAEVHNKSMTNQWGFVPMDQEVAANYLAGLRSYADPDLLTFCEVGDEPVGVCITTPDIGPRLRAARRGSGFRMFSGAAGPKKLRVGIVGVLPEYRKRGVVALLMDQVINAAIRKGYRQGELSLIMDKNDQMNSIINSAVGGKLNKTYRVYRKEI